MIFFVALAVTSLAILSVTRANSSNRAFASPINPKHYKATRPLVVDKQTGQLRLPTQEEVDKLVTDLSALAKRPTEGLQESTLQNGAVGLDLDGGYGGVMLGRPNADGTWETRCVFTLAEGTEFLGLEEDNTPE